MRLFGTNISENRIFVETNLSVTYENTDLINMKHFFMVSQDTTGRGMVCVARI